MEHELKIRFFKFTKQFPMNPDGPIKDIWFYKDSICVMIPISEWIDNYTEIFDQYGVVSASYTHSDDRMMPTTIQMTNFYRYEYGHEVFPEVDGFNPEDIPSYNEVLKTYKHSIDKHIEEINLLEEDILLINKKIENRNKILLHIKTLI